MNNTDKKKIRCAIIGTGRIGSSLETDSLREKPASHAGAISHNRETILVAGSDVNQDNLQAFGKLWHLPQTALYSDAETMLQAIHPDIVHIASDTDAHIPLLTVCLEHKVPVIVLEKPIGSTVAEAQQLYSLVKKAEENGTSRIVVNHERRFALDYRRVKEIINSKELGELRSIHARLYMGKKRAVEKVLYHDGTHMVDILNFLVGPWSIVSTHKINEEPDRSFLIIGKTTDIHTDKTNSAKPSVSISLEVAQGRDHLLFEVDLSFSEGRVRVGNGTYEEWKSRPSTLYEQFRSLEHTGGFAMKSYKKTGYFSNMMNHAVALFRNPLLRGESTFEDGFLALQILEQIIEN